MAKKYNYYIYYNWRDMPQIAYLFNEVTELETCSPVLQRHTIFNYEPSNRTWKEGKTTDIPAPFGSSEYWNVVSNHRKMFNRLKKCGKLRGNSFFEGEGEMEYLHQFHLLHKNQPKELGQVAQQVEFMVGTGLNLQILNYSYMLIK